MLENVQNLEVEYIGVESLVPYANNAKIHTEKQIAEIANSIEQFGFNDPIAVWTNGSGELEIVEGHGRILAAKELGMDEVPIIHLDHLSDEERRAYTHVHNQTTLSSGFDDAILSDELAALDFDWEKFGFEPEEEEAVPFDPESVEEDEFSDLVETRAQLGDIWKCGDHRVMCGSSTDKEALDLLMDGDLADFVFTDPPFGVAIGTKNKVIASLNGGNSIQTDIEGDTLAPDELQKMLTEAFTNLHAHCADHCSYYITIPAGGDVGRVMYDMLSAAGIPWRHQLIWAKSSPTFSLGRLDYDYQHEPVCYTWTKSHKFYGGYGSTLIDDNQKLEGMSNSELKDIIRAYRQPKDTSVVYCDKPKKCDLHPTMKPIKLIARFMHNSSREGDIVLDIFGGSGSTLITAEQMKRKCRIIELDPHYVDVIISRWEEHTGKTAELIRRVDSTEDV